MKQVLGNSLRFIVAMVALSIWCLVVVPMFHVAPVIEFALGLPVAAALSWILLLMWREP